MLTRFLIKAFVVSIIAAATVTLLQDSKTRGQRELRQKFWEYRQQHHR